MLPAVTRLDEIPGISADLAQAVIAETGLDMTRFPTPGHLVSWAGLCPTARQSGAPHPRREDRPGQPLPQGVLGPDRRRRRPHRDLPRRTLPPDRPPPRQAKALVAVARSILVIIWHLLADPAARFTTSAPATTQARIDTDRRLKNHIRQIQALGFEVAITKAA